MQDYLTTRDVAGRLGVTVGRVVQLCASGAFGPLRRRGRDWVIPAEAVDAYEPRPRGWPKGKSRKKVSA